MFSICSPSITHAHIAKNGINLYKLACRVVAALIVACPLVLSPVRALAAPSDLDTSFTNDKFSAGMAGAIGLSKSTVLSAELLPDNSVQIFSYVVIPDTCSGLYRITLTDTGGEASSHCYQPSEFALNYAFAIHDLIKLPSGKYLLRSTQWLARLNADGSVDTSFGPDGRVIPKDKDATPVFQNATKLDYSHRMVADSQNRVYMSLNYGVIDGVEVEKISRFKADGSLDLTWGTDGYVQSPLVGGRINRLAVDAQDRLVVSGSRVEGNGGQSRRAWLVRFNTNGTHDTSFKNAMGDSESIVRLQAVNNGEFPADVTYLLVESSGSILVAVGGEVRRYSENGVELASRPLPTNEGGFSHQVGLSPAFIGKDVQGRILVAGVSYTGSWVPGVVRLNQDLSLDTSFDAGDSTPNGFRYYLMNPGLYFDSSIGPRRGEYILEDSEGRVQVIGNLDNGTYRTSTVLRLLGSTSPAVPDDSTPDAFSFINNNSATANSTDTSNTVTITGINVPATISVNNREQGGSYSIGCTGVFTSTPGSINNGQTVCVRHNTGNSNTTVSTTLTVGGVSATFVSSVPVGIVEDTEPDNFSFTAKNNVEPLSQVESDTVTITGINTAAPISVYGGEYRVGTGVWTMQPGTVQEGDTIQLRVTASALQGQAAVVTVTIGGVSTSFTATTTFPAGSSTETLAGLNGTVTLATVGGTLTNVRMVAMPVGAGWLTGISYPHGFFAFDVASVTPGDTVTVQITLPAGSPAVNTYVKCNSAGVCAEYSGASFSGNIVTLTLTDGGAGDADGVINGHIVDPGAPAVRAAPAPSKKGGAVGSELLGLGLLLLALQGIRRKARN